MNISGGLSFNGAVTLITYTCNYIFFNY